jgi:hypothetical protein
MKKTTKMKHTDTVIMQMNSDGTQPESKLEHSYVGCRFCISLTVYNQIQRLYLDCFLPVPHT